MTPHIIDKTVVDLSVTEGGVLIMKLDDGPQLEIPLDRLGALNLARALVAFACPQTVLRTAAAAGEA